MERAYEEPAGFLRRSRPGHQGYLQAAGWSLSPWDVDPPVPSSRIGAPKKKVKNLTEHKLDPLPSQGTHHLLRSSPDATTENGYQTHTLLKFGEQQAANVLVRELVEKLVHWPDKVHWLGLAMHIQNN
ncbi:hypothetical protein MRX96_029877 [Rhipicephalus microplus]